MLPSLSAPERETPPDAESSLDQLLGRDLDVLGSIELLETSQVHGLLEQRYHVRVERLPVRVLEVVFLALLPRQW